MKINLTIALTKEDVATIVASQGKLARETNYDVCARFIRTSVKDSLGDMERQLREEKAFKTACPACSAKANETCVNSSGGHQPYMHSERVWPEDFKRGTTP